MLSIISVKKIVKWLTMERPSLIILCIRENLHRTHPHIHPPSCCRDSSLKIWGLSEILDAEWWEHQLHCSAESRLCVLGNKLENMKDSGEKLAKKKSFTNFLIKWPTPHGSILYGGPPRNKAHPSSCQQFSVCEQRGKNH